jgi:hypothetical protein
LSSDITNGLGDIDPEYRDNLVGNSQGAPLDPALRVLPGKQISNSAPWVVTSSASWTWVSGTM